MATEERQLLLRRESPRRRRLKGSWGRGTWWHRRQISIGSFLFSWVANFFISWGFCACLTYIDVKKQIDFVPMNPLPKSKINLRSLGSDFIAILRGNPCITAQQKRNTLPVWKGTGFHQEIKGHSLDWKQSSMSSPIKSAAANSIEGRITYNAPLPNPRIPLWA